MQERKFEELEDRAVDHSLKDLTQQLESRARVIKEIEAMKAEGKPAQTGGFLTGADAIQAIAYAIKKAGGSTDGATLAAVLSHLTNFPALGGPISFTAALHSAAGRPYRIVEVNDNVAKVVAEHTVKVTPNIH